MCYKSEFAMERGKRMNEKSLKLFREKLDVLSPFRAEMGDAHFEELPYLMMSLHVSYVLGGNEELYERGRKALLRQFLEER